MTSHGDTTQIGFLATTITIRDFDDNNAVTVKGIWGYYHDAGDWDGYPTHSRVPMALLMLYDLAPGQFHDGEIGNRYKLNDTDAQWIDEGSNGMPDLLDEAAWLINYFRRAKDVLRNQYGGTGGVPGYVGRDALPQGNNITAWQDTRVWRLSGQYAHTTFDYAALAAWYAICLNKFHQINNTGNHPQYNEWLNEAKQAYQWGESNRQNTDLNDDNNDEFRARGLAASLLYRATGTNRYQQDFRAYFNWDPFASYGEWSNQNYFDIAASMFALIPNGHPNLDAGLRQECRQRILAKADGAKLEALNANAFRMAMERYQFLQLGGPTTPRPYGFACSLCAYRRSKVCRGHRPCDELCARGQPAQYGVHFWIGRTA